jgi:hypothetical protein
MVGDVANEAPAENKNIFTRYLHLLELPSSRISQLKASRRSSLS